MQDMRMGIAGIYKRFAAATKTNTARLLPGSRKLPEAAKADEGAGSEDRKAEVDAVREIKRLLRLGISRYVIEHPGHYQVSRTNDKGEVYRTALVMDVGDVLEAGHGEIVRAIRVSGPGPISAARTTIEIYGNF